jgi:alpha-L-arabinofuranosidase
MLLMKKFLLILLVFMVHKAVIAQNENILTVYVDSGKTMINKNIYGHFAEHLGRCIYGGIWVGEDSPIPNTRGIRNDVVEALKEIQVPVIRWPGGCFADAYHWMDGIGPKKDRKGIINKFWGGLLEDNSFGTHEFLDFCSLIGAEPYLAINVGSGTVQEAADWIDYVNSEIGPMADLRRQNGREKPWNVKYWGIGNESWGCGGHMTARFYSDLFKQYSTYCNADYKILSGGIPDDYDWTETIMKETQKFNQLIQGYSFHHYTITHNWTYKGSATDFTKEEWLSTMKNTLAVDDLLKKHTAIMDKYDPENKIMLAADEWGNWFDSEPGTNSAFLYQQNTLRDALTAGLYFNIFNNHAERVRMANIAQTVNVLQSVILTQDDKMVKTPTFYAFKMYKVHQDATLLPFALENSSWGIGNEEIPAIDVSASRNAEGIIHISIVNIDPDKPRNLSIALQGKNITGISAEIITSDKMNALNDFGKNELVNIKAFKDYKKGKNEIKATLPAKSIVTFQIR